MNDKINIKRYDIFVKQDHSVILIKLCNIDYFQNIGITYEMTFEQ